MGYAARKNTQAVEVSEDIEVVYFCAKCGATIGKGQMPKAAMYGVCPACAAIIRVEQGRPFAREVNLDLVPLRERTALEQRSEQMRKQLGLPPSIILRRS